LRGISKRTAFGRLLLEPGCAILTELGQRLQPFPPSCQENLAVVCPLCEPRTGFNNHLRPVFLWVDAPGGKTKSLLPHRATCSYRRNFRFSSTATQMPGANPPAQGTVDFSAAGLPSGRPLLVLAAHLLIPCHLAKSACAMQRKKIE
jgi:hypothetical protein